MTIILQFLWLNCFLILVCNKTIQQGHFCSRRNLWSRCATKTFSLARSNESSQTKHCRSTEQCHCPKASSCQPLSILFRPHYSFIFYSIYSREVPSHLTNTRCLSHTFSPTRCPFSSSAGSTPNSSCESSVTKGSYPGCFSWWRSACLQRFSCD